MNDIEWSVFVVGRVLVGLFFLIMGMSHFGNMAEMTAMVAEEGIPAPLVAVVISGVLLVLAGLSFVLGFHPPIGVVAAGLFLIPVTLVMHNFWLIDDPIERQRELSIFLRNMGLLGAVLTFLAIPRPWKTSLDEYLEIRRGEQQKAQSRSSD